MIHRKPLGVSFVLKNGHSVRTESKTPVLNPQKSVTSPMCVGQFPGFLLQRCPWRCSRGAHVFFRGLDFEKVLRREVQVPPIRHLGLNMEQIYIYIHIHIHIYTYTHRYIYIHTYTYTHIHTYIHIYIYTHIHIYIYIHVDMHIHTFNYRYIYFLKMY